MARRQDPMHSAIDIAEVVSERDPRKAKYGMPDRLLGAYYDLRCAVVHDT